MFASFDTNKNIFFLNIYRFCETEKKPWTYFAIQLKNKPNKDMRYRTKIPFFLLISVAGISHSIEIAAFVVIKKKV